MLCLTARWLVNGLHHSHTRTAMWLCLAFFFSVFFCCWFGHRHINTIYWAANFRWIFFHPISGFIGEVWVRKSLCISESAWKPLKKRNKIVFSFVSQKKKKKNWWSVEETLRVLKIEKLICCICFRLLELWCLLIRWKLLRLACLSLCRHRFSSLDSYLESFLTLQYNVGL